MDKELIGYAPVGTTFCEGECLRKSVMTKDGQSLFVMVVKELLLITEKKNFNGIFTKKYSRKTSTISLL